MTFPHRLTACAVAPIFCVAAAAAGWGEAVEVRHEDDQCVTYRARLAGPYLIVEATHQPGWHTYAMDNKRRAAEKLAGRPSLGIDGPTEIALPATLQPVGEWLQSEPEDLSRPEMRWYTWGFSGRALFARKVTGDARAGLRVGIRGQACSDSACKNVDLDVPVGSDEAPPEASALRALIEVRR